MTQPVFILKTHFIRPTPHQKGYYFSRFVRFPNPYFINYDSNFNPNPCQHLCYFTKHHHSKMAKKIPCPVLFMIYFYLIISQCYLFFWQYSHWLITFFLFVMHPHSTIFLWYYWKILLVFQHPIYLGVLMDLGWALIWLNLWVYRIYAHILAHLQPCCNVHLISLISRHFKKDV